MVPGNSAGSGANGLISGGVASDEHICGVVGVNGVVGVVTRIFVDESVGESSFDITTLIPPLPLTMPPPPFPHISRFLFGTRP